LKEGANMLKRCDTPNQSYDELLSSGWKSVSAKYDYLIRSVLNMIRSELDRLYWNKNQKEISSPFDNTGEVFENDYVTIRAYDWNENELPNFDTDQLKVFWYKHSNRGVDVLIKSNDDIDSLLVDVLNNTIESLKESFANK
jgi:hypothetical protein